MSIESELIEATGQKARGASEKEQEFLIRVAVASNNLGDDDWAKLSVEAQEWLNVAGERYDAHEALPSFDAGPAVSSPATEPAEDEESDEPEEAEEAAPAPPVAKASKKAEAQAKASKKAEAQAKPAKQPATPKAEAPSGEKRGGSRQMRELICEDPNITAESLKAKLNEEGYKISDITFNATYYDVRSTIRCLSDKNKLKVKVTF